MNKSSPFSILRLGPLDYGLGRENWWYVMDKGVSERVYLIIDVFM